MHLPLILPHQSPNVNRIVKMQAQWSIPRSISSLSPPQNRLPEIEQHQPAVQHPDGPDPDRSSMGNDAPSKKLPPERVTSPTAIVTLLLTPTRDFEATCSRDHWFPCLTLNLYSRIRFWHPASTIYLVSEYARDHSHAGSLHAIKTAAMSEEL